MAMRGTLLDVFEISGRGVVALLKQREGFCRIGDRLQIGDKVLPITGIEMVNYNAEGRRRLAEGWQPPLGVLLADANKEELARLIGQEFATLAANGN
jgi:translation elongation factor EF-Tu-like GTPase